MKRGGKRGETPGAGGVRASTSRFGSVDRDAIRSPSISKSELENSWVGRVIEPNGGGVMKVEISHTSSGAEPDVLRLAVRIEGVRSVLRERLEWVFADVRGPTGNPLSAELRQDLLASVDHLVEDATNKFVASVQTLAETASKMSIDVALAQLWQDDGRLQATGADMNFFDIKDPQIGRRRQSLMAKLTGQITHCVRSLVGIRRGGSRVAPEWTYADYMAFAAEVDRAERLFVQMIRIREDEGEIEILLNELSGRREVRAAARDNLNARKTARELARLHAARSHATNVKTIASLERYYQTGRGLIDGDQAAGVMSSFVYLSRP